MKTKNFHKNEKKTFLLIFNWKRNCFIILYLGSYLCSQQASCLVRQIKESFSLMTTLPHKFFYAFSYFMPFNWKNCKTSHEKKNLQPQDSSKSNYSLNVIKKIIFFVPFLLIIQWNWKAIMLSAGINYLLLIYLLSFQLLLV